MFLLAATITITNVRIKQVMSCETRDDDNDCHEMSSSTLTKEMLTNYLNLRLVKEKDYKCNINPPNCITLKYFSKINPQNRITNHSVARKPILDKILPK